MSTSVTWNGTSYSIPAAGESNWSALSNFLIALANNAQTVNKALHGIRTALTSPVTLVAATDFCVVTNLTAPGAVAVTLPVGVNGQIFAVIDGKGDAGANSITISGTGQNISGAASYVINQPRGAVLLQFSTTEGQWLVLSALGGASGGENFPVRTATTSPVAVLALDFCIMTHLASPGAVAVNLPAGVDGALYAVVDALGDAATNNITITPASGNINGAANYVISLNKGAVLFQYNTTETQWKILAEYSNAQAHINASSGIHGVSGSVVGTTDVQALTNKDLDGGTASNTLRITIPKNTTTNLNSLTRKKGTLVYDSTLDVVKYDDGSVLNTLSTTAPDPTTLSDVAATKLGFKRYLSGTAYNGGGSPTVTASIPGWATVKGVFIPYTMQDGTWRMRFNFTGTNTGTATTNTTFTINGVTFANISAGGQSAYGSTNLGNAAFYAVFVNANVSTIDIFHVNQTPTAYLMGGDVELASKPTWAY